MILQVCLLISLSIVSMQAVSFSKSKKVLLKQIYFDNRNTFYCNNPYEIKLVSGKEKTLITEDSYIYKARNPFYKSGKVNIRAKRVEWEHIMPAHNFGRHLQCWKNGGRKACKKDFIFKMMESDMHNLVPSIGELNANRSNYKYAAGKAKSFQYGNCNFEINFKEKRVLVSEEIKGDIARIYLYMSEKYKIRLSKKERKMMNYWNKIDPVSKWERIKNKRVEKLQGNLNSFIN